MSEPIISTDEQLYGQCAMGGKTPPTEPPPLSDAELLQRAKDSVDFSRARLKCGDCCAKENAIGHLIQLLQRRLDRERAEELRKAADLSVPDDLLKITDATQYARD